ncbi:MAG TPA: ribokinase [Terriglobia bacterium]|nr:ribokinase [Terriglobia bacterium]
MMNKVIMVVGSLNMDFVVQLDKLPLRGETVHGRGFQMLPGGKGANQAYAVGKLGGKSRMVGCVGEDVFGEKLKSSLQSAGVDTTHIRSVSGESSGVALIHVEAGGQNQIVIAAGANSRLSPSDVEAAIEQVRPGFVLMQLESPMETVEAAAHLSQVRSIVAILDPAPARTLGHSLLQRLDLLTPNETEALLLLGRRASTVSLEEAPQIATQLLQLGPKQVILKLGEKGAWMANRQRSLHFPAHKVAAVDATAAGDTFNGALAVALAEGKSLQEAISFANGAAALSVTRLGAQASVPSRNEVEAFLSRQPLFTPA